MKRKKREELTGGFEERVKGHRKEGNGNKKKKKKTVEGKKK